jgi:hypothetical protein
MHVHGARRGCAIRSNRAVITPTALDIYRYIFNDLSVMLSRFLPASIASGNGVWYASLPQRLPTDLQGKIATGQPGARAPRALGKNAVFFLSVAKGSE